MSFIIIITCKKKKKSQYTVDNYFAVHAVLSTFPAYRTLTTPLATFVDTPTIFGA
jgi:hypothetical protein